MKNRYIFHVYHNYRKYSFICKAYFLIFFISMIIFCTGSNIFAYNYDDFDQLAGNAFEYDGTYGYYNFLMKTSAYRDYGSRLTYYYLTNPSRLP